MLAISSATKEAYIGIEANGKRVFANIDANCKQSESILVKIDELLEQNGIEAKDIGNIAVVVGPGSFTGIRIGIALVKGLCAGKKEKVVAISSLDYLAREALKSKPKSDYICAIDALSELVYVKEFDKNGNGLCEEKVITREEFEKCKLKKYGLEEESICENKVSLTSETLLEIALEKEHKKQFADVKSVAPIYLRKSQAEENLKKNKKTS